MPLLTYVAALDLSVNARLVDPYPAKSELWRRINHRQLALSAGWGTPDHCQSLTWLADDSGDTFHLALRTTMAHFAQIGILVSGKGFVDMTLATDATGTHFGWHLPLGQERWLWTGALIDGSAASGRSVVVNLAEDRGVWTWAAISATLQAYSSEDCAVSAIAIRYFG